LGNLITLYCYKSIIRRFLRNYRW